MAALADGNSGSHIRPECRGAGITNAKADFTGVGSRRAARRHRILLWPRSLGDHLPPRCCGTGPIVSIVSAAGTVELAAFRSWRRRRERLSRSSPPTMLQ